MPSASSTYIAASANRAPTSACRLSDGLVAFGSGHFVALWHSSDERSAGVHATLPGHQGDVTALKFLQTHLQPSRYFVSGDSAGVVRLWEEQQDGQWTTSAVLTGHTQSISALAILELPQGQGQQTDLLVLSGGSEGAIQAWRVSAAGAELLQKIDLKGKIPLEMAMSLLPDSSSIVLAVGSTETRIQIFSTTTTDKIDFTKALSLEGHSDWVLLASGSQDNYIRLWRFSRLSHQTTAPPTPTTTGLEALDELERALDAPLEDTGAGELRVKAHDWRLVGDGEFSCSAEAVLLGHDAWVTGLHWAPRPMDDPNAPAPLQLLSASADRSMILWTPEESAVDPSSSTAPTKASIWTSARRFGEFSSATNLGFFGALWGTMGRSVLASGWGGSWHVWRCKEEEEDLENAEWEPVVAVAGHFAAVKSVQWEPEGEYLLSAGSDMSTRLHAPWRRSTDGQDLETWHELGRPQIHGYPLASIAFTSRVQFVSGADEKIVRVFDAPKVFVSSARKLSGVELGDEESRPMAADVPPLGLSNRAIANTAEAEQLVPDSKDPFDQLLPVNFTVESHPPFEEQLLGSTLWPETEKLYGHGFELIALHSAHALPIIATACKATSSEHAVIRLFDSNTWKPIPGQQPLEGHALTITSLKFSRDDRWLLSTSRDRTWRLFERRGDAYVPAASAKSHARIIWDGCWAAEDSFFATASRDKTVKVWTLPSASASAAEWSCAATLKFEEAATAVAAAVLPKQSTHILAVGLENGMIRLLTAPFAEPSTWTPFLTLDASLAHVLTVTSLDFSPKAFPDGRLRLASGSDDRSVRIIDIAP
ncbi:WD40-repeat-containing domain protein [Leucosporidium creatinivorum]|uniref:Elongator complex protein 2 n=1 Tax=Leucosporidium creatinivorum TaxID=106004 RepID=A0A1Y2FZE8_9BASI|nr:WD40-repeat-containing domain protein [Leucosporidium creatinivorum]